MSAAPAAETGRAPFLDVRSIAKRYPGVLAVDAASLAVAAGERVGLVGKNGAGKSTLIKILAGAIRQDAGELTVGGELVDASSHYDPARATALGIACVHQELTDVPALSVAENVRLGLRFPRRLGGLVDWRALRASTRALLDRVGAEIDPRTPVAELSIAEQRLVMIARGLAADARLLVLDEPTASLTDAEIRHLHAVIDSLAGDGVGIVYVSHRLDEIFRVTDRVVVMRDEVLRVEGLSRAGVVEDVGFTVRGGEVTGLAGLVGAGRTEVARLVFGADRRSAGRVFVRGREVDVRSPAHALAAGIVLLPEDRRRQGALLDFGIRENVSLPDLARYRRAGWLPSPSPRRESEAARGLMRRLGIRAVDERQPVGLLSGGNQQKVILAKWLDRGAEVFIFDEPTHGIDVDGKEDVYRRMADLAAAGRAVVFISSDLSEFERVCARVLVMREGRLVATLEGDAIGEADILERCYPDASPQG